MGSAAINGTGDAADDVITGNSSVNTSAAVSSYLALQRAMSRACTRLSRANRHGFQRDCDFPGSSGKKRVDRVRQF
jgi:hypothetical protein